MAVVLTYMVIFAYFQVGTYEAFEEPYNPFHEGAQIEIPEDEIELQAENIMLPADFDPSDLKNAVRDVNEKGPKSEKDYSTTGQIYDGAKSVYDLENQMFADAGGAEIQEKIRERDKARKKREEEEAKKNSDSGEKGKSGASTVAAGSVSLEFSLTNRSPVRLPKPTYMCGVGSSGRVTISIEVNQNGEVVSASHDPSRSSPSASYCMISQAEKFAKKSRFSASGSAPNPQKGWIAYIFVSQ